MDRRTLLAIGLCFLIFMGWQKFYIEPRLPKATTAVATNTTNTAPSAMTAASDSAAQPVKPQPPTEVKSYTLLTGTGSAFAGNGGKFFTGWQLSQFRQSLAKDASSVELKTITHSEAGEGELAFDLPEFAYANNVEGQVKQTGDAIVWTYEDANMKIVREINAGSDKNYVDLKLTAEFKTKRPKFAFVSLSSKLAADDHEERDRQLLHYSANTLERLHLPDLKPVMDIPGNMKWIGAQSRYFLMAMIPQSGEPRALAQSTGERQGKISLVYPINENKITIPLKVYFGPKEMDIMKTVEPALEPTIDFGMFTIFAYPILKFMKWLHEVFGNWGIAIILLTLVIKIITFPLTYKSMKSMKKMAVLQPQIKALQEKYKDDKQTLNQEMISFMRTQGYNPLSGCLPILIQMPVFFALYQVLYSSIELYQAPFYGWIHDLSVKDPFYITPVLLTGLMYLQQKLTPSTITDPMQAKMMQWMPVMFGLLMINLPAGLTIYMLVNAGASIVQQFWINKKLNAA